MEQSSTIIRAFQPGSRIERVRMCAWGLLVCPGTHRTGGLQQGTTGTSCEDREVPNKDRSKTKFDILKTYVCSSTDYEHTYDLMI